MTGISGIGKSYTLNNFPITDDVEIIDLLDIKELCTVRSDVKTLILDHAESKPHLSQELVSRAASMGHIDYILLVGQNPNDLFWTNITHEWDFEISFKGGFNNLIIEVSSSSYPFGDHKIAYTSDMLSQELPDIKSFLNKIKKELRLSL